MSLSHRHATRRTEPLERGDALIVVDVQRDFLPGGALGVPHGDEVVPRLNRYSAAFAAADLPIVFTRDWHPPNHCSFVARGGPWPPHCVAGSEGAAFAEDLVVHANAWIVSKATQPDLEAYSGFEGTDLAARLHDAGVERVFVGGLATDYCVRSTVTDAIASGFAAHVLEDAIRAVDVEQGDGARALEEMQAAGATSVTLDSLAA